MSSKCDLRGQEDNEVFTRVKDSLSSLGSLDGSIHASNK